MNVLPVKLHAGERWAYTPPPGHAVLWSSPVEGDLLAAGVRLHPQELIACEESEAPIEFDALTDAQFILGSAVPHAHELALRYHSVHTSPQALEAGEARR